FPTPREPAEIQGGTGADVLDGQARVIENRAGNASEMYVKGAYAALEVIRGLGARLVVLKEYSPCGSLMIYDGKLENRKVAGSGGRPRCYSGKASRSSRKSSFERLRLRGE
ncbi:DUF523 domain-containing protein, partial [Paenibacillus sp. JTLBN-2024]